MNQHFQVLGTGLYLPQARVTDEEIDARAGRPPGWTRAKIGVLERYECRPPENLATMASEAISAALRDAAIAWEDVDLILDGSTCRYQPIPCNAAYVQQFFGPDAQGIPCMDVHSTCLGFLLGVHVANALFAMGSYRHILIICSEAALQGVDWTEPESAGLMGDGAGAVVLRRAEPSPTYHFAHETHSSYLDACQVRRGGHLLPPTTYTPETESEFRFHMDGRRLLRAARRHLVPMIDSLIRESEISRADLHVIPHQAAPKALAIIRQLLDLPVELYQDRVAHLGNLISASIPAVLHLCRADRAIVAGDRVLLMGTSAGYSQAGLIFRM
jgi:3-oxoacyl-[acyl-carrier-protein] synthase III